MAASANFQSSHASYTRQLQKPAAKASYTAHKPFAQASCPAAYGDVMGDEFYALSVTTSGLPYGPEVSSMDIHAIPQSSSPSGYILDDAADIP